MSNHFSADNLKFPGDDRRLDLTDLFVFSSPQDPDTTVIIIDSNPTSAPPPIPAPTTGLEFYPGAVHRINIDNDGDNLADVAFTFVFSEYQDGRQTGTAWYATGAEVLHYDRTKPATYPNGRVPTDDVASLRTTWLTNGKVPPSGLKPHDDLLARFPYLGPPNP